MTRLMARPRMTRPTLSAVVFAALLSGAFSPAFAPAQVAPAGFVYPAGVSVLDPAPYTETFNPSTDIGARYLVSLRIGAGDAFRPAGVRADTWVLLPAGHEVQISGPVAFFVSTRGDMESHRFDEGRSGKVVGPAQIFVILNGKLPDIDPSRRSQAPHI